MAKSTLNSVEFIQKTFSPFVAVLSSPLVDKICQKNNLSFIELLEPFCKINKDVCYKDPSGNIITIENLQITLCDASSKPPEPAVARRLLNESVTSASDENVECVTINSGNISVQIPSTIPWFEKWREIFLKVQFPSDHEFTKYYIACMIVITSQDDNPLETLSNKVQQFQHMLSMSPPKMMPKWFSSSVLRYYILLHDILDDDIIKAEKVYDEMKSTYNANCCYMLQINSQKNGTSEIELLNHWKKFNVEKNNIYNTNKDINIIDIEINEDNLMKIETGQEIVEQSNSEVIIHPLSPELESQRIFKNYCGMDINGLIDKNNQFTHVQTYLSSNDIDRIKTLIPNFIINALMPFVETQMQYLNEMVFNKKGVSKSLFSVPKRWFTGAKPGSPVSIPNAHYYHPDSPELQMRRLGDLCFMFGAYNNAFQAYHAVKKDFHNDGAWLYYAGALEMTALSAFMIGQDIKKAQEYTEEGVITYLHTCRMPQFATRLTLCATECLKNLNMYGEAAGRLLLMTSEDSDLRSALLLEEASYCFIKSRKPLMPRKYAFHLVLAGHRFAKAGQKKHSLRCYRQAYQVYQDKNWNLAEDHIHFTMGKLASALKQKEVTVSEFAKLFTRPSTQLPAQQASFLKEYFLSLIELQKEKEISLPYLQIPQVNHSSIEVVLNTLENEEVMNEYILAGKNMSEKELSSDRWWKLEEKLVSYANNSQVPAFFKHTVRIFSSSTNNSVKPTCVVGEQIKTSVDLVNILNIPYILKKIELTWIHSLQSEDHTANKNQFADTEIIDSLSLNPDSVSKISLHITPKMIGELHITGIMYTVALQSLNEGTESISITGHTLLKPKGMRVVSTKNHTAESAYLSDYRLQFTAVDNVPRLKIYFKNLPSEMFCGEVKQICIELHNVGTLPVHTVLFTSSEISSFSVPYCKGNDEVFFLLTEPLQPEHSTEVTIHLRGCDYSGRVSIDLLFYYDVDKFNKKKLNYRLIYHTLPLFIHQSLQMTATVSRSLKLTNEDMEIINIKLQVQNKNEMYDSINFSVFLHQISLFSPCWKLYDVIFSSKEAPINLDQQQVAFLTLKAKRLNNCDLYSDLILGKLDGNVSSVSKPFNDFIQGVIKKFIKSSSEFSNTKNTSAILECNAEDVLRLNSVLILFWKAELKNNDTSHFLNGQHHLPLIELDQKYSSEMIVLNDIGQSIDVINISPTSSFPSACNSASKELLLVKMKHPSFVSHSFLLNRICTVSVEVVIQNCCDESVDVKLDTSYQTNNNLNKISESSSFLWLGLVLHTFTMEQHSCIKVPLSVCVGNTGTYDLGSQFSILAKKCGTDVFISQSSVPHALLCVSNEVL